MSIVSEIPVRYRLYSHEEQKTIADAVMFPDGSCTVRFRDEPSTVHFESYEDMEKELVRSEDGRAVISLSEIDLPWRPGDVVHCISDNAPCLVVVMAFPTTVGIEGEQVVPVSIFYEPDRWEQTNFWRHELEELATVQDFSKESDQWRRRKHTGILSLAPPEVQAAVLNGRCAELISQSSFYAQPLHEGWFHCERCGKFSFEPRFGYCSCLSFAEKDGHVLVLKRERCEECDTELHIERPVCSCGKVDMTHLVASSVKAHPPHIRLRQGDWKQAERRLYDHLRKELPQILDPSLSLSEILVKLITSARFFLDEREGYNETLHPNELSLKNIINDEFGNKKD